MAQRKHRDPYRDDPASMEYLLDEEQRRPASGRRSRRRKKNDKNGFRVSLILGALLIAVAGWIFAGPIIERYTPSNEPKDLNEWFEVAGDEVKIYFNDAGNNDIRAKALSGAAYLPISWVHANISKRFFRPQAVGPSGACTAKRTPPRTMFLKLYRPGRLIYRICFKSYQYSDYIVKYALTLRHYETIMGPVLIYPFLRRWRSHAP